jgi:predicted DNA-binding transcriptional regulator YafY
VSRDGGQVEVRIAVDRPAASRVAVLLLQLGPECSVVSPESLQDAVLSVAQRILDAHSV